MIRKAEVSFIERMSTTNQWCVPDEMHDVLSVDFDRSLSGLDVDLCSSTNNMSASVFAVPEISSRKEDPRNGMNSSASDTFRCLQDISSDIVSNNPASDKCQIECYPVSIVHGKKIRYSQLTDIDCSNNVKRFCFNKEMEHSENLQATRCRPHNLSTPEIRTSGHFYSSGSVINTILSQVMQLPVLPTTQAMEQPNQSPFHYILLAATSISTKINEETLTYLNQGQSYEIRLRKTGFLPFEKSGILKSIIYVGFQERRLQYIAKEQIKEWQSQRNGERILEVDVPLSYGILEATNCITNINQCEILWDPAHDVGIFIKINCISTEFTQRKHGGEKGVPFRVLIETYNRDPPEKLHAATCQVKVFKPKGADRKHKTDREKMCKRSQADKEKYQPQFEYTVFRDLGFSEVWAPNHPGISYSSSTTSPTPSSPNSCGSPPCTPIDYIMDIPKKEVYDSIQATSTTAEPIEASEEYFLDKIVHLTHDSSAAECAMWLQKNMFDNNMKEFGNFTGADLLNLTRADLIEICGAACGIRLYNTLHGKSYMTIYVRLPIHKAFSAIYLKTAKVLEFSSKIKAFCGLPADCKCDFYVSGPSGTRVILTNEVICNMLKDSLFVIECKESNAGQQEERYSIFLKHVTN